MDWANVEPDEYCLVPVHYTQGREGRSINKIIIHHNGGNLSIPGIRDVWMTRQASAHYQVDINGRIGQIVDDSNTAWHAGDWEANLTSIGIEHADNSTNPWSVSEATLEAGAHLVAALCHYYGLGRPTWNVNVFPHQRFTTTECPASLIGSQHDAYMARAQWWYDNFGASDSSSAPSVPASSGGAINFPAYPFDPNGWDRLGDIEGPDQVHGGDTRYDGPNVIAAITAVQNWLLRKGYANANGDPYWADGEFGQPTVDAVKAFQADCMPGTTYPGEVWADDYEYMVNHND